LSGAGQLRRVVRPYKEFFNDRQPRQGIGDRVPATIDDGPAGQEGADDHPLGRVQCDQYLGGLLKSYRTAA
jgi:hypothetical protein